MRALLAVSVVLAIAFGIVGCSSKKKDNTRGTATPQKTAASSKTPGATTANNQGPPPVNGQPTVTASGLQIIDTQVGSGAAAKAGDTVTFHYTGWLESDGSMFGTSVDGNPIQYPLTQLIPGWQEGIPGMKAGGKRRLIIPSALGYGAQGRPSSGIPGGATLIFDIELVSIP